MINAIMAIASPVIKRSAIPRQALNVMHLTATAILVMAYVIMPL
jgi:hypothetical protein